MTDDLRFPEYRAGSAPLGIPGVGLVGITAGLAQMSRSDTPPAVMLSVVLGLVVVFALLWVAARRTATLTDAEHVVVHGAFGTRTTAWRDIQAIEIESNPVARTETSAPREFVVLYDREGRRIGLPHLHERSVFALEEEVRVLRELWERLRGEDWVMLPEVAAEAARRRKGLERTSSFLVALMVAMGAVILTVVLFVILLLSGVWDDPEGPGDILFSPATMAGVPVVTLLVTYAVLTVRRRSRRQG